MSISSNTNLSTVYFLLPGSLIQVETDSKSVSSSKSTNKVDLEQYYSPQEVFDKAAEVLRPYSDELNHCIDFSAGNGDFSRTIQKINASIRFDQFDLLPHGEGIQQKDWFSVKPEDYAGQEVSLIGFNPPYGRRGSKAFQFIKHAQKFQPKFMVLLLPFNFEFPVLGYESLHQEAINSRFTVFKGSATSCSAVPRFLDLSTKLHLFRRLEGKPSDAPIDQITSQISKHDLTDMKVMAFSPWSKWNQGIAVRHRGRNSGIEFYFKDKMMGLFFVHVIKQNRRSGNVRERESFNQMRSENTFFKIQMLDAEVSTWLQNYQFIVEFAKTFFDAQNGAQRMAITRPTVFLFCKQIRSMNLLPNPEVHLPDMNQESVLEGINFQGNISIYRIN